MSRYSRIWRRATQWQLRFKQGEDAEAKAQMGDVDGRNREAVRDELEALLRISDGDVISVDTGNGQSLIRAHGTVLPTALEAIHLPVAQHLVHLQARTSPLLVMPSIGEITDGQFRYLSLLASIYGDTAHRWNWTEVTFQVPEDSAEAARIKEIAVSAATGGHLVKVEAPVFQLGNRTYTIDHPLASTAHSVQVEPGIDPAALRPGDTFRLIPGADAGVTTAKIVDWTPGVSGSTDSQRGSVNRVFNLSCRLHGPWAARIGPACLASRASAQSGHRLRVVRGWLRLRSR